ncbi:MAG: MBL fold metallo-hydrolase [Acidimicrobiia bacterium]
MATIRRLTDSCVLVTTDANATLFDPGFHTFESDELDKSDIPDVTRVLITHAHADHVSPPFVRWLVDRRADLQVFANSEVADLLRSYDVDVDTGAPGDVGIEDVLHGRIPNGAQPPNRSFTIEGLFTHPGDSREPKSSGPVLACPLIVPWDSARGAVEFATRLAPRQVVPIHDFYLTPGGREWIRGMVGTTLKDEGIELVDLDWGDEYTV